MEVMRAGLTGMEGIGIGDGGRGIAATPAESVEHGEEARKAARSADAVNISATGRALASGEMEADEAAELNARALQGIQSNPDMALGAHTALNAYRVASLLSGLD